MTLLNFSTRNSNKKFFFFQENCNKNNCKGGNFDLKKQLKRDAF